MILPGKCSCLFLGHVEFPETKITQLTQRVTYSREPGSHPEPEGGGSVPTGAGSGLRKPGVVPPQSPRCPFPTAFPATVVIVLWALRPNSPLAACPAVGLIAPGSWNLTCSSNPGRGTLAPKAGSVSRWPRGPLLEPKGRFTPRLWEAQVRWERAAFLRSSQATNRNVPCSMVRKQETKQ